MAPASEEQEWKNEKAEHALARARAAATLAREVERYLDAPGCNTPAQATAQARLRWALEEFRKT